MTGSVPLVMIRMLVQGEEIERIVEAEDVRNGLAITPAMGANLEHGRFQLTHVASGWALGPPVFSFRKARKLFETLLARDIDWTQDHATILRTAGPVVKAAYALCDDLS